MRALSVIPGRPDSAEVRELADPPASDGSVLVEGLAVGICGTDSEIVEEGAGMPPPGEERLVLCHESLGRVVDAPAGSSLAAGDLVAGVVRRPDPEPCACCAVGEWDFCRNGRYTERGIKGRHGYGAQRWRVDPEFAVAVDGSLGDLGVLLEPTSIVAKAWEQIERIGARACSAPERVLVTGAGPIGLLAALLAVQRGFEVHILDVMTSGPKPALATELGATYHHEGVDRLGFEPDVVIECTGMGSLVFDLTDACAPNAVICLTGISSGRRQVPTNLDEINKDIVLENTVIFGSVNAALRHYQGAERALAAADRDWLGRLITRQVPLERWPEALHKQEGDVKVVVDLRD